LNWQNNHETREITSESTRNHKWKHEKSQVETREITSGNTTCPKELRMAHNYDPFFGSSKQPGFKHLPSTPTQTPTPLQTDNVPTQTNNTVTGVDIGINTDSDIGNTVSQAKGTAVRAILSSHELELVPSATHPIQTRGLVCLNGSYWVSCKISDETIRGCETDTLLSDFLVCY
jgi:hypothetical protein